MPLRFAPYQHQLTPSSGLAAKTRVQRWWRPGPARARPILPLADPRALPANKGKPGIKAILIYPMNALATDQARRIARAINDIPSLNGVRAGIYADAEPKSPPTR